MMVTGRHRAPLSGRGCSVIGCHLARAAAVGHEMPKMSYFPLVPEGTAAKVTSAGNGFAVNIGAQHQATVDEFKQRAGYLSAR